MSANSGSNSSNPIFPSRGYAATPNGTHMYSSPAKNDASIKFLKYRFFGINFVRSMAMIAIGGRNIVTLKSTRLIAVYKTAFYAAFFDTPTGSLVSGSTTSIPFFISVYRMTHAFKKPAIEQAQNELTPLIMYFQDPVFLAV